MASVTSEWRKGMFASRPPSTIMVFDDGSSFEYLADIEIPNVTFHRCRTFEDVEHYLTGVRRGEIAPPAILGIDVFCDIHPDFGMFDVDAELNPNICGYQLYEHVIRPAGKEFEKADVVFFTSFAGKIGDISTQRLKQKFAVRIENCARVEFRQKLLDFAVGQELIDAETAKGLQRVGLTQEEYWSIFKVVADEFRLSDGEKCNFFGVLTGHINDAHSLVGRATVANERIDELLSISILLDRVVNSGDKREYLESLEPPAMVGGPSIYF